MTEPLYERWDAKRKELARVAAEELAMRLELAKVHFPSPKEGANTIDLGDGLKLKGEFDKNYRLAPHETKKLVEELCALGDAGKLLAAGLIGWKPALRVGAWRKLPAALDLLGLPKRTVKQIRGLVDKALTISDATPSLELIRSKT